jgi:hypothetical protein
MTLPRAVDGVSPSFKSGSRQAAAVARLALSRQALLAAWARPLSSEALAPALRLVRRHPAWAMALAALAGGVLVRARAWRWGLSPRLLGRWLPVVLSAVVATPTGGIWADLFASVLRGASPARERSAGPGTAGPSATAGQSEAAP